MNILQKAASIVMSSIGRTFRQPSFWSVPNLESYVSKAGINLTHNNALSVTAYYSAVTLIAQTIGQLPLILYERMEPRGKRRANEHQLYSILHDEPNPWMSAYKFRETLQGHLLTWGNAFAYIDWDMSGNTWVVQELFPLRPDRMTLEWQNGEIVYNYTLPSGQQTTFRNAQILHIPGFGYDGLIGYDPLTLFRDALGLAKACEEFGARFFGNGSALNGVITHPGRLTEDAKKRMRQSWEDIYSGLSKAHKVAILEEGVAYQSIGIPPEHAQFLQTRQFQISEIARIFHVPPHMIGDLERATFSNIEHQGIEFVKYTLGPWLKAWESEINRKLLPKSQKRKYFAEHLVDGLLRGDTSTRFQAYATGRQWGWYSANDVRELENLNPIEGGDQYMVPLNMMPASMASEATPTKSLQLKSDRRRVLLRARTAERYQSTFRTAAAKVVAHEIREVRRAAKSHLDKKDALSFGAWLNEWYGSTFKAYVVKTMTPVMRSLADAIFPLAADEVNGRAMQAEDEAKLKEYVEDFADRYTEIHRYQATEAVKADEPMKALTDMFDEWEQVAPQKVASNETVGLSSVVSTMAWAAAGIMTYVWVTTEAEPCPICQDMDGQRVRTLHPPLHDGCMCQLAPI